jgi:hypothetical protein
LDLAVWYIIFFNFYKLIFLFLPFVFRCYTLIVKTIVLSIGAMKTHTLTHWLFTAYNTQPGICPVVPEKHVKTLVRLVDIITDNHVPPECSCILYYENAYKYAMRNTIMLSHVTYPPRLGSSLIQTAGYKSSA